MRESMGKTTFKNNIHPRISQWHIQFTGYVNQRWSLNGRWYPEGWISSKLRSPLGSTPRPAMKRSGTNKSSLLWYLAVYDVFSWNLAVPDICLICVISYHDTWHDILLSLTSSLHIFVSYPYDSGHINKVFPETCWSARTPGWSGRGFWSNPWGPLGQSIKQRLSSPVGCDGTRPCVLDVAF